MSKRSSRTSEGKGARKGGSVRFSREEQEAMKERIRELKEESLGKGGEERVLALISDMSEPDRSLAWRIHEIVRTTAPRLEPRTWYGMPAYSQGGKVVCYFQNSGKFKARYSTLGFTDSAHLDSGEIFPVAFGVKSMSPEVEERIRELLSRAVRDPP